MITELGLDLTFFAATVAIDCLVFFLIHIVVFQFTRVKKLATTLNNLIFISVLAALLITFVTFRDSYSSFSTYVVSTVGATLASVFILGFYGFSGPICADRSASAHMALALMEYGKQGLYRDELQKIYGYEKVFDKRIADFIHSGIVIESEGKLQLTRKGAIIAGYFLLLGKLLRIQGATDGSTFPPRSTAKPSKPKEATALYSINEELIERAISQRSCHKPL